MNIILLVAFAAIVVLAVLVPVLGFTALLGAAIATMLWRRKKERDRLTTTGKG